MRGPIPIWRTAPRDSCWQEGRLQRKPRLLHGVLSHKVHLQRLIRLRSFLASIGPVYATHVSGPRRGYTHTRTARKHTETHTHTHVVSQREVEP